MTAPQVNYISEGYAALDAGNPDNALIAFEKALEADGQNLEALLGQALIYSEKREHKAAFSFYDAIVQSSPKNAVAWNGRGLAAIGMEDFDEALTSFDRASKEQPNGSYLERLAWTRMCRGEFAQAAQTAKNASLQYSQNGIKSIYPFLIAYFSYLEVNDAENARRTLRYANVNSPVDQWPFPVIQFINDDLSAAELISYVENLAQETEAHTYIGLRLRSEGKEGEAAKHLAWVTSKGDQSLFECSLARAINLQNSIAQLDR